MPDIIDWSDEWYNFETNPRANVTVLMSLDETSLGNKEKDHPITWCQEIEKGRSWYTGFGHRGEAFLVPQFQRILLNGLLWSARIDAIAPE